MIDCLILGDSIAVGISNVRPECVSISKGGLNTWQWNKNYLSKDLTAKSVIISLSTNDHQYIKTHQELEKVRAKVNAERVYWVLPMGNSPKSGVDIDSLQHIVAEVAERHNDIVIATKRLQKDGIHPSWAGYKELANQSK
jgi:lysophospholipase L1-like esterase